MKVACTVWMGGKRGDNIKLLPIHIETNREFNEFIQKKGGKIIALRPMRDVGVFKYVKDLYSIFRTNNYDFVHIHFSYKSFLPGLIAYFSGVKKIGCHAHSASFGHSPQIKDKMLLLISRLLNKIIFTDYFTCSDLASKFVYGDSFIEKKYIYTINNGVDYSMINRQSLDVEEFKYNNDIFEDTIIIGHVGGINYAKNHDFMVKLIKKMKEENIDFKFIFVGDGPDRERIKDLLTYERCINNTIFLGHVENPYPYIKLFDVFLLPSRFEGLPSVVVEAQALGVPCIISNVITKECDMGVGLVRYISLDEDLDEWINHIMSVYMNKDLRLDFIRKKIETKRFSSKQVTQDYIEYIKTNTEKRSH